MKHSEIVAAFSRHISGNESVSKDYEVIKTLIKKYPGLAREKIYRYRSERNENNDFHLEIPLFAFASRRVGATWTEHMELLKLVYNAFPGAIECANQLGMLPLHVVCENSLHPRIIMYFLKKNPKAAGIRTMARFDWLPLSYYLMRPDPHKTVVKALVKAAPTSVEFEYTNGDVNINHPVMELPSPLAAALRFNCKLDVLESVIPNAPKSQVLKLDMEDQLIDMTGVINSEKARVLAKGMYSWITILQFDTSWFSIDGFVTFLATLVEEGALNLKIVDVFISSGVFGKSQVKRAFSDLVRQSSNLVGIRARKPSDGSGPRNDDSFLDAILSGISTDHPLRELGLSRLASRSFGSLCSIISEPNNLKSIALHNVTFTAEGVKRFAGAIQKSDSVNRMFLSVCKMPSNGLRRVLAAVASSSTVEDLSLLPAQGQDLVPVAQLGNIKSLYIEIDTEMPSWLGEDSTNAILELLQGSTNLVKLGIDGLNFPTKRLSEILKANSILKSLVLFNCDEVNDIGTAIVKALRDSNGTLCNVELQGKPECRLSSTLTTHLQYYTALNSAGRAKVMKTETATVNDVVCILENLSAFHDAGHEDISDALRYGVMRETPSLWSGEYHDEARAERFLEQAVEEVSLGN